MKSTLASNSPSLGLHCIWSAVVTEWITTHSLDSRLPKLLEVPLVPLTVCHTGHRIKQHGVKKGGGGTTPDAQDTRGSRANCLVRLLLTEHTDVLFKMLARNSKHAPNENTFKSILHVSQRLAGYLK